MKRKKQNKILQQVVLASLLSAMTVALTFFVKIPAHNGYIHLGDAVIYLTAALLPTPLAIVSAGLGGMLADALGGYTLYIVPTLVVKALLTLPFSSKGAKILTKRNVLALPTAAAITLIGYFCADAIIVCATSADGFAQFLNSLLSPAPWAAAVYSLPGNAIQAVASIIIFIPLATALDKINIKGKI